jgi:hypothetical protein
MFVPLLRENVEKLAEEKAGRYAKRRSKRNTTGRKNVNQIKNRS